MMRFCTQSERLRLLSLMLVLALAVGPRPTLADDGTATTREATARENTALAFAQEHHPELAGLLTRLKKADGRSYDKAIRDLSLAGERLERMRSKDPVQYGLALRVWTLDSRVRLLAARLTMSGNAALESQLLDLLEQRRQARLELLQLERDRAIARLERLDHQVNQLEADPQAVVERDLARLKREVAASAKSRDAKSSDKKK